MTRRCASALPETVWNVPGKTRSRWARCGEVAYDACDASSVDRDHGIARGWAWFELPDDNLTDDREPGRRQLAGLPGWDARMPTLKGQAAAALETTRNVVPLSACGGRRFMRQVDAGMPRGCGIGVMCSMRPPAAFPSVSCTVPPSRPTELVRRSMRVPVRLGLRSSIPAAFSA